MQIPHQSGSPDHDPQPGGGPGGSSPYPPWQQQSSYLGSAYQQGPYGQPSPYGQAPYQHQDQSPPAGPPYQQTSAYGQYTPYGQSQYDQQQGYQGRYGYNNTAQQQHGVDHNQPGYAPPNQPPYQQQAPYYPSGGSPQQQPPAHYGAAADYHSQQAEPAAMPPPGAEDDRGLLGALAGGTAGAFAGHQVHHGLLGALGGAFADHKLQDAVGDHKKQKKNKKQRKSSHSSSSSSSSCSSNSDSDSDSRPAPKHRPHQPAKHLGNFSGSATQITIDGDFDLIASCEKVDGSRKLSSISLNQCLTNSDGRFEWSSQGNLGASARNARLVEGGKILEAELANCDGHWKWARVVLDEKISNNDGELVLV